MVGLAAPADVLPRKTTEREPSGYCLKGSEVRFNICIFLAVAEMYYCLDDGMTHRPTLQ